MRRLVLLLAAVVVAGAVGAAAVADAAGPRARAMKVRLEPFGSCDRLIDYGRRHAGRELRGGGPVLPPGGVPPDAVAPTAQGAPGTAPETAVPTSDSRDSSQTNVQEEGVDEPDIVKSDGRRIFAVAGGRLHAIDARSEAPELLGSIELETGAGELLLHRDRLLVISYVWQAVPVEGAQFAPDVVYPGMPATVIAEIDVSDPTAMRVVRTETVDGSYVSARQNGATARIVLTSPPAALEYGGAALRSRARGWLPRATLENRRTGRERTRRLSSCRRVRRPRVFAGLDTLTVLSVDMRRGLPAVDVDALMTGGQTVYASDDGLYVATQRFVSPPDTPEAPPPELKTAIHRFDVSEPGATRYRASGEVAGYVLSQFALSERAGVLRVASTESPVWWRGAAREESQSYVTTLKESGDVLLPLGRVGGLGRGERIFGVRFLADVGYVVTFRQTDPLYTVDLAQPSDPRVAGELKIRGWSAYLHPVGDGLLLGVGQDATDEGAQLGSQLSLFDVGDLARPVRLSRHRVGGSGSSSEVEYDHHAFLWWASSRLAVLPVGLHGGSDPFVGAIGFRVARSGIGEVGRVAHDSGPYPVGVRRALVVGGRLFTISELGAKVSELDSFAEQAWLPFPAN
jgi:uncharacterized secreted protein with C-terminal beta-propeller domain